MNTLGYGKVAQAAISALSHLAVNFDGGKTSYKAAEIAEARNLPRPLVAKVLTQLGQTDFVSSVAGRNGGYSLVVAPERITFYEVVILFEQIGEKPFCPLGPGWCARKNPCAVHDELEELHQSVHRFLRETHFGSLKLPDAREQIEDNTTPLL